MLKMKKRFKQAFIAGLTLLMLLSGASSVFAHSNGNGNRNDDRGNYGNAHHEKQSKYDWGKYGGKYGNVQITLNFSDMNSKDFEWVMKNIARLASRGVFHGYDDGTFKPNRPVSRIEAIVAAVRLLGLEDEAKSDEEMNTKLYFKDADKIYKKYPQTVGYVAVALEHDLFAENENEIQPDKSADRLWATTLLVKALGLKAEAQASMNADLNFKDARLIPAGSRGYVAVAVEKKLIFGYNDKTFKPFNPVTRAELAALLDRTGEQLPEYNDQSVAGTVSGEVQNNTISIVNSNGVAQSYAIDPNVFVFRDNAKVDVSELRAGDQVEARLYNNVIVFIEVKAPASENGTFTGIVKTSSAHSVTIAKAGQDTPYALTANAVIYRNGSQVNADALRPGDEVFIQVVDGKISFLQVTKAVAENAAFAGTVKAKVSDNKLTIARNGQDAQYTLASNVIIYRKGTLVDASDLRVGDQVFVQVSGGKVTFIQVTQSAAAQNDAFNGVLKTAVSENAVTVAKDGRDTRYELASNVIVYRNGSVVEPSAVRAGDEAYVVIVNGKITLIQVTKAVDESPSFNGVIKAGLSSSNQLTITRNGVDKAYTVDSDSLIFRNGMRVAAANLKVGDQVSVLTQAGSSLIVLLQVTTPVEQTDQPFTVDGLFKSLTVNSTGDIATITVSQSVYGGEQNAVYNVSPDVTVSGDLSQLVDNHPIQLKGENRLVSQITIK